MSGDDEHARSGVERGDPYRGGPPRPHQTRVDVGVPDPPRRRAFVLIGILTLLLIAGVFAASPNSSTAVTLLGIAGLIAFARWVVRRLEGTVEKDVRARIAIDHFALCADIEVFGTAAVIKTRIELQPNTTFSLDEVHGPEGKELTLRIREGNEVRLDIATYALDEADAARPALKRLDSALSDLRPMIEEREERRSRR